MPAVRQDHEAPLQPAQPRRKQALPQHICVQVSHLQPGDGHQERAHVPHEPTPQDQNAESDHVERERCCADY